MRLLRIDGERGILSLPPRSSPRSCFAGRGKSTLGTEISNPIPRSRWHPSRRLRVGCEDLAFPHAKDAKDAKKTSRGEVPWDRDLGLPRNSPRCETAISGPRRSRRLIVDSLTTWLGREVRWGQSSRFRFFVAGVLDDSSLSCEVRGQAGTPTAFCPPARGWPAKAGLPRGTRPPTDPNPNGVALGLVSLFGACNSHGSTPAGQVPP